MNNFSIDSIESQKTYALVVGIETYKYHPEVPNAAQKAIDFVNWLRLQGVPSKNIFLFISSEHDFSSKTDVLIQTATEDNVARILDEKLLSSSQCGDLLYVFWGGHGYITKKSGEYIRRLCYQNSDGDNFFNLNLEKLETALKTSQNNSGFRIQVFIIDACANILEDSDLEESLESCQTRCRLISGSSVNNQEIFYGASDLGVSRGRLSQFLLNFLSSSTSSSLCLDSNEFYAGLRSLNPPLVFKYKRLKSDFYDFDDTGILPKFKTILANRTTILKYFKQMISDKVRSRAMLIKVPADKERELLIERLSEEADDYLINKTIIIDLRYAKMGVSYFFSRVSKELGVGEFPELIKKVRQNLPKRKSKLPDALIIEAQEIENSLSRLNTDEEKIRLFNLTEAFLKDLSNLEKSGTAIIINGYYEEYNQIYISQLRTWLEEKFIPKLTELPKVIVVMLGSNCFQIPANISPVVKHFELDDPTFKIRIESWISYCSQMQYSITNNGIKAEMKVLEKLGTDQIYHYLSLTYENHGY